MRILALETSSLDSSVALLDGQEILAFRQLPRQPRLTASLLPAVADQLRELGWRPSDLQLVGVTIGPGSFTGLRVGVTAAKTLAYALRIPVIGVDTLEVIAWQAISGLPRDATLHVLLDAQRKELFQAQFQRSDMSPSDEPERSDPCVRRQSPTRIVSRRDWLDQITLPAWATGTGLKPLLDQCPAQLHVVEPQLWVPQAGVVGQMAGDAYEAGHRADFWTLTPNYLRPSAAEEKAATRSC